MAASRLLENVFGTSNIVWASIIGLILIYLAAGYWVGGRWADRANSVTVFAWVLIAAGIFTCLVPVIARPVLRSAADAFDTLQLGPLFGSFASVIVLLIFPITLMGVVSPFAIRLTAQTPDALGKDAGSLYAVSTLGSFFGTFLPVLLLIPWIGTSRTFVTFGAILILAGAAGLWLYGRRPQAVAATLTLLVIPLILIFGLKGNNKASSGQIVEAESAYNYIQVLEVDGYRYLRLNEGQGVHSVYHPTELNYYGPWEQVSVAPFFNPAPYDLKQVKRVAIIGLAAGTAARQATEIYGDIPIDGIEIDPEIVKIGRQYFDMNQPNLNVIVEDGRWGLSHSQEKYSIISIDAYRPPYIPAHLTTQEFFQLVYDHLEEDGVMVINVGRSLHDRRLINALSSTILTIFPNVHVMDVPNSFNSILFATRQPSNAANLADNYIYLTQRGDAPALLINSMAVTLASMQGSPETDMVFTDDRAPIEWITNSMIFNFFLSDDAENLQ